MPTQPTASPVEDAVAGRPNGDTGLLRKFEELSENVTGLVSGHWGTLTACLFLLVGTIVFMSDRSTFANFAEQLMTMFSLALLFLLQRSQTKATLSLQVKLNELLRATHTSDNHLINIERLSEDELKELHDRYQRLHDERSETLDAR